MLPLQSPLEAYRSDLTRNPNRTDFGRSDTVWLLVAHCLHRLSRAQGEARRSIAENCASAIADLATTVTPDTAEEHEMLVVLERLRGALRSLDEVESAGIVVSASRTLAGHMGEAGALWLMYSAIGHARVAGAAAPPRELGLAMADQAWVARTLGDLNSADDLYDQVLALGTRRGVIELEARALLGKGVTARVRGNYPDARNAFRRGLARASAGGLSELESVAHQGLLIAAATAGDWDTALVHGWSAYELAQGNADREAELLINISQVSLDSGYPEAALRGFLSSLVRSTGARLRLPSLGGAALAAARVGNRDLVETIARVADESLMIAGFPFESASALRSLSDAYDVLSESTRAEDYRLRARTLARKNGFFEIVLATEAKEAPAKRAPAVERRHLTDASHSVIESLEAMDVGVDAALLAATP